MSLEKIKGKIDIYKQALNDVNERRKYWVENTKELLQKTLRSIAKDFDIGWHSQTLDERSNYETINLTFGKLGSGIIERTEKRTRAFIKDGGTLVFCQTHIGTVAVIIMYPSIEELVFSIEKNKLIKEVSPQEVTEEFIYEQVEKFLDEMTKWEKSSPYDKIGFK